MRRYLLFPGMVRLPNDGQEHYVGARRLARLWGVPLAECVWPDERHGLRGIDTTGLVRLGPRPRGDYDLEARLARMR